MIWRPAAIFLGLVFQLFTSAVKLSPPQNLTVDLLDFQANVHWLSGEGNSPNTRYTVEMKKFGRDSWEAIENCTLKVSTRCHFVFPMDMDKLMEHYLLKIVAIWGNMSSEMIYPRFFQPYGDSAMLSGPDLKVFIRNQSIYVHVQHYLESVLSQLNYSINLTKITQDQSIQVMTDTAVSLWTFPTTQLSPGRYCVTSSVIHKQQMRNHHQSEQCIFLDPHKVGISGQSLLVVVPFLLLGMMVVLLLWLVFRYMRPQPAECPMPRFLDAVTKSVLTTKAPSTEVVSQAVLLNVLSTSMGSCPAPSDERPASFCGYETWGKVFHFSHISTSLPSLDAKANVDLRFPGPDDLYREVQDESTLDSNVVTNSLKLSPGEPDGDATCPKHWLLLQETSQSRLALGSGEEECQMTLKSYQSKDSDDEGGMPGLNMPYPSEYSQYKEIELDSPLLTFPSGYEPRDPVTPISQMYSEASPSPSPRTWWTSS